MSWTDKELDDLFKDAASGQSFEYNAAYFKDIEAQLPVNKKKKRGIIWFWGSSVVVLILLSSLFVFKSSDQSSTHMWTQSPEVGKQKINQEISNTSTVEPKNSLSERSDQLLFEGKLKDATINNNKKNQLTKSNIDDKQVKSDLNKDFLSFEDSKEIESAMQGSDIGSLEIAEILSTNPSLPEVHSQNFINPILNRKKSKIYIEIAGGLGQSPVSSTENGSSRSLNWNISGGYILSKNDWSLSAGVGIGEHYYDNLYIKERSMIYGFGVNTYDNHYQFTSMFKLDLPMNFSYRFGSHELSAGLNTSIPIFTRVSFVELKDGIENNNGKSFSTTTPYFRKVYVEPSLGYRFDLDENWSIGATLKAQLMNPLGSDRIKGVQSKLPLSGQITLRRTIELK